MKNYNTHLAFIDLLFNVLLCFITFFIISMMLINNSPKNKDIETRALFVISITWPEDFDDDVDIYVEDPKGEIVFFSNKESDIMFLDRDDLGHQGESTRNSLGQVEYLDNREVVSIRAYRAGEYVINLHLYSKRSESPVPVTISVDKIHPYKSVYTKTINWKINVYSLIL